MNIGHRVLWSLIAVYNFPIYKFTIIGKLNEKSLHLYVTSAEPLGSIFSTKPHMGKLLIFTVLEQITMHAISK